MNDTIHMWKYVGPFCWVMAIIFLFLMAYFNSCYNNAPDAWVKRKNMWGHLTDINIYENKLKLSKWLYCTFQLLAVPTTLISWGYW